jgi:hypothetical protein
VLNAKDETLQLREEVLRLRAEAAEHVSWSATVAAHPLEQTAFGATVRKFSGSPSYYVCPVCFDARSLIPLQDAQRFSGEFGCPKCKAQYPIKAAQALDPVATYSAFRSGRPE